MSGTGTGLLDFGAFPGASDTTLVITGQAGIVAGSLVEAWLLPASTADHTADEHWVETIKVMAGNIVAGTGFTIYGVNTNQVNEPLEYYNVGRGNVTLSGPLAGGAQTHLGRATYGGTGTRLYGKYNVAWVWN
jgi:hypothetical protein